MANDLCDFITTPVHFDWFTATYTRKMELLNYWKQCTQLGPDVASTFAEKLLDIAMSLESLSDVDEAEKNLDLLHRAGKFLREIASYPASEMVFRSEFNTDILFFFPRSYFSNIFFVFSGLCMVIAQSDMLQVIRIHLLHLLQRRMHWRIYSVWQAVTPKPSLSTWKLSPSASAC
jgi:hypothetical protein